MIYDLESEGLLVEVTQDGIKKNSDSAFSEWLSEKVGMFYNY